jgi:hypothetical protein
MRTIRQAVEWAADAVGLVQRFGAWRTARQHLINRYLNIRFLV